MENPIDSTKKLLDLIHEFGKTAGYKVNTQKSKAFLYTNNETAETEIRKKKRMPSLNTPIQHSIGSPSHSNQPRKTNKMHPNWKGGNETVTFSR